MLSDTKIRASPKYPVSHCRLGKPLKRKCCKKLLRFFKNFRNKCPKYLLKSISTPVSTHNARNTYKVPLLKKQKFFQNSLFSLRLLNGTNYSSIFGIQKVWISSRKDSSGLTSMWKKYFRLWQYQRCCLLSHPFEHKFKHSF